MSGGEGVAKWMAARMHLPCGLFLPPSLAALTWFPSVDLFSSFLRLWHLARIQSGKEDRDTGHANQVGAIHSALDYHATFEGGAHRSGATSKITWLFLLFLFYFIFCSGDDGGKAASKQVREFASLICRSPVAVCTPPPI